MTTATEKPVKRHEFTATRLTQPGEHVLCAVIIGPDRDDPSSGKMVLHLRTTANAVEILRIADSQAREMIMQHLDRLMSEFRKEVTA
jgi:hypothetical protein